jgi:hypothetical protein
LALVDDALSRSNATSARNGNEREIGEVQHGRAARDRGARCALLDVDRALAAPSRAEHAAEHRGPRCDD